MSRTKPAMAAELLTRISPIDANLQQIADRFIGEFEMEPARVPNKDDRKLDHTKFPSTANDWFRDAALCGLCRGFVLPGFGNFEMFISE
jgi:hypothetical protein